MAKYFSYFPTLPYDTFDNSGKTRIVTDIFKRVRSTLESRTDASVYYNYNVLEGQLPEHVAYNYYGSTDYHWVVLLMNEIRDPQWSWPLNSFAFEKFIIDKYGSVDSASGDTHHYETVEIVSDSDTTEYSKGDIILPKGLIVEETFSYTYLKNGNPITLSGTSARTEVTNLAYEISENEKRGQIILLRRNLLREFVENFEDLVTYKR